VLLEVSPFLVFCPPKRFRINSRFNKILTLVNYRLEVNKNNEKSIAKSVFTNNVG